jgi:hypothetical protein
MHRRVIFKETLFSNLKAQTWSINLLCFQDLSMIGIQ